MSKFDYSKLRELRDQVASEVRDLTKTLTALNTILESQSTATPKAETTKRRKSQWHVCPVGCGTKHRLSHDHMAVVREALPETKAATAFASTTHAA